MIDLYLTSDRTCVLTFGTSSPFHLSSSHFFSNPDLAPRCPVYAYDTRRHTTMPFSYATGQPFHAYCLHTYMHAQTFLLVWIMTPIHDADGTDPRVHGRWGFAQLADR